MLILALGPPSFLFSGCQRFIHRCKVARTWSWPLTAYGVKVKNGRRCTCMKAYAFKGGTWTLSMLAYPSEWVISQQNILHSPQFIHKFFSYIYAHLSLLFCVSIFLFSHDVFVLQDWMLRSCHGRMPQRSQDTVETSSFQDWFQLSAFWKWHIENAD